MASDYDPAEFVDSDFESRKPSNYGEGASSNSIQRAPTREEVDSKVLEAQQKLAELKRAQEELERERAALEETRRRQIEFKSGRDEMVQNLTRGLGLLEESEFNARRDAEQSAKALGDLRDGLAKIQGIHEETWTKENFAVELTRALTVLENARMEWNSARLKFPLLTGNNPLDNNPKAQNVTVQKLTEAYSLKELCKLGFALTWPLALAAFIAVLLLGAVLIRK
jgi:hypothetical protein